jgi:RNA polymerase sigma-70 factor (ECF subfamily)
MLRSRATRREESLDVHVPDPVVTRVDDDPAEHALLADSVGIALLVVLDTLPPAERLAFVLHDVFAVPFEQIGPILDRTTAAAKQLASRARRRLRTAAAPPAGTDLARQWTVVDAFLAASREGDFEGLLAILDPDIVLRADTGDGPFGPPVLIRGAREFIARSQQFVSLQRFARRVLVNGGPGFLVVRDGEPIALIAATVQNGKITEMDILADPVRLRELDLVRLVEREG